MRLTAAGEYACLALLAIAERSPEYCKRQEICDRFDIPPAFLQQVLLKLVTAGFINSQRGAAGGFKLARDARSIAIADVIRSTSGPLAPTRSVSVNFYDVTPLEASPAFHGLVRRVRDAIADILENTTLEDVLADEKRIAKSRRRR